jgi:hypothetical protein
LAQLGHGTHQITEINVHNCFEYQFAFNSIYIIIMQKANATGDGTGTTIKCENDIYGNMRK